MRIHIDFWVVRLDLRIQRCFVRYVQLYRTENESKARKRNNIPTITTIKKIVASAITVKTVCINNVTIIMLKYNKARKHVVVEIVIIVVRKYYAHIANKNNHIAFVYTRRITKIKRMGNVLHYIGKEIESRVKTVTYAFVGRALAFLQWFWLWAFDICLHLVCVSWVSWPIWSFYFPATFEGPYRKSESRLL